MWSEGRGHRPREPDSYTRAKGRPTLWAGCASTDRDRTESRLGLLKGYSAKSNGPMAGDRKKEVGRVEEAADAPRRAAVGSWARRAGPSCPGRPNLKVSPTSLVSSRAA